MCSAKQPALSTSSSFLLEPDMTGAENNKILAVKPENLRRVCPAQLPSQCSGLLVQGQESATDFCFMLGGTQT